MFINNGICIYNIKFWIKLKNVFCFIDCIYNTNNISYLTGFKNLNSLKMVTLFLKLVQDGSIGMVLY